MRCMLCDFFNGISSTGLDGATCLTFGKACRLLPAPAAAAAPRAARRPRACSTNRSACRQAYLSCLLCHCCHTTRGVVHGTLGPMGPRLCLNPKACHSCWLAPPMLPPTLRHRWCGSPCGRAQQTTTHRRSVGATLCHCPHLLTVASPSSGLSWLGKGMRLQQRPATHTWRTLPLPLPSSQQPQGQRQQHCPHVGFSRLCACNSNLATHTCQPSPSATVHAV